jgi:SAM-dependent methyltransferase
MTPGHPPPRWKLPTGVDSALWSYTQSERIAEEENAFFKDDPLCRLDLAEILARWRPPGRILDLGCGSGRASLALARCGFKVLSVDLSQPLLRKLDLEAKGQALDIQCVRGNLCRLDFLPRASFRGVLLLYSTLGMIRGQRSRRVVLQTVESVLEPTGEVALHVHNLWAQSRTADGRAWLARLALDLLSTLGHRSRAQHHADRAMTYRGIPGLAVHLYRWNELNRDLRDAGLQITHVVPIDSRTFSQRRRPGLFRFDLADGWLVFASRTAATQNETRDVSPRGMVPITTSARRTSAGLFQSRARSV